MWELCQVVLLLRGKNICIQMVQTVMCGASVFVHEAVVQTNCTKLFSENKIE